MRSVPARDRAHDAFGAALAALHGPAARAAVDAALLEGLDTGAVYAEAVRPALREQLRDPLDDDPRARLAHSIARTAVADLALRHPVVPSRGRSCAVLAPPGITGELDARLLADVLEADGWDVVTLPLGMAAEGMAEAVRRVAVDALVVPASDADQLLAATVACAHVRRLADPPLVAGVQLEVRADAAQLPTDALVTGTPALRTLLGERLGDTAARWGVRMARDTDGLTVWPTGVLDATNVARLRQVVDSRTARYATITIDLAELARCPEDGAAALAAWREDAAWHPALRLVGDARLGA